MATKGFSAPVKTPAQQDEIRRQAKAKRKHGKKGPQAPVETFTDGLVVDRLNRRGRWISRTGHPRRAHNG